MSTRLLLMEKLKCLKEYKKKQLTQGRKSTFLPGVNDPSIAFFHGGRLAFSIALILLMNENLHLCSLLFHI